MRTFRKGVHPPDCKQFSCNKPLEDYRHDKDVFIPLSQHIGAPSTLVIEIGSEVKAGQLIAKAASFVSANIFSSVSGKIKGIVKRPNAMGVSVDHVHIINDGKHEYDHNNIVAEVARPFMTNTDDLAYFTYENMPTREEILDIVAKAGIVGMGGASFPSHVKYSPKEKIDYLVVNAAECEPYITCDYRLMMERTKYVLVGAKLLQKVLQCNEVIWGIENNKREAGLKLQKHKEFLDSYNAKIMLLKTKYPQGSEKQLIYATTKRKVPDGGLPSQVGVLVANLQTLYALYKAVFKGRPLFKRAMTISGDAVKEPKNLLVLNGTPYSTLLEYCGGQSDDREIDKVISGGPMMGFAQDSIDAVTAKGTSSILFLSSQAVNTQEHGPCINCSSCYRVCPQNLLPMFIDAATEIQDWDLAKKYGAMSCISCGCCSYSCPAKRPLVQNIKQAREAIIKMGKK